jgi:hypothetical protein
VRPAASRPAHSSPTTTARYAAYDKSQLADVMKALDEQWQASRNETPD